MKKEEEQYLMNMVEIQQRGIEFLRSVQKVGTSYRALGLAERSSTDTRRVHHMALKDECNRDEKRRKLMVREMNTISIRHRSTKSIFRSNAKCEVRNT